MLAEQKATVLEVQRARRALQADTPEEVEAIAAASLRDAGLLDHPDLGEWLGTIVEAHLGEV